MEESSKKLTKDEKIQMLKDIITVYESLPAAALSAFVTNYELVSALTLLCSILEED